MKNIFTLFAILAIFGLSKVNSQSILSPDTVCAGSTNNIYDVPPTVGSTYSWSFKNGLGTILPIAGRSDSIRINFGILPGVDTLRLVENGVLGCLSDTVKLAIVILPNSTATISGTDSICINNSSLAKIRIVLTGTSPWSLTYTDGTTPVTLNNIITSPINITTPVYNTAGIKPFTITSANGTGGCSAIISGTGSVTVFPKPTPSAISHY